MTRLQGQVVASPLHSETIVKPAKPQQESTKPATWGPVLAIAALALAMGLPAVRGGFVGGDDHRLVRDHVLVNRPSLDHAVKLFTMPKHRDLYQPLPLLSFSGEFLVAGKLGLFGAGGADDAAWLFHLDNVLLHALNAVLVWLLMTRLQGDRAVAAMVAVLFAVHPFQAEVVSWINGRMLLLSTLFALLSMLAFCTYLRTGNAGRGVLTVVLVLLSAISKIRPSLVVLLFMVPLILRIKPAKRFWMVWVPSTLVTVIFVVINQQTTAEAGLFAGSAEVLQGPRMVRVVMALAFYLQHFVWPVGLSSYYPTPSLVSWTDPATLTAMGILGAALLVLAAAFVVSRQARFGLVWFFATIAVTLPIFLPRNVLAADRYMYLPMIGLGWVVALGLKKATARVSGKLAVRSGLGIASFALIATMIGVSWHTGSFYADPEVKTRRTASLFPDTPRVWYYLGWVHHGLGEEARLGGDASGAQARFATALQYGQKELVHEDRRVLSEAYQLIGTARISLGEVEEGLKDLRHAAELDPTSHTAVYRLASNYEAHGLTEESIRNYEETVRIAPSYNPAVVRLAKLHRQYGRRDEAREMYELAIQNNGYEVSAIMGLAEMDVEDGTPASNQAAVERLEALLDWMPENLAARTNLGVAFAQLGRTNEAIRAYLLVTTNRNAPPTAILNLAFLYADVENSRGAARAIQQLGALNFQAIMRAASVNPTPIDLIALSAGSLVRGDYPAAMEFTSRASNLPGPAGEIARGDLMKVLGILGLEGLGRPWVNYLVAQVALAEGNAQLFTQFLGLFEKECPTQICAEAAEELRNRWPDGG